eukprot:TRINITY_DN596_c4_g1_i2.p1 TRINITY_DN596_c4_g1~~TRINITY_DN596_c4_g1_i2.p1  ORF type:complete len:512 (+),score=55.26 TRINITY_DN596_c4_g1_i2:80-1615(+)
MVKGNGGTGIFSPTMVLFWFCLLQLLNFVERGAVASNGVTGEYKNETCANQCDDYESKECRDLCGYTGFQGEFDLTNQQTGLLASLFTVGLTVASPISAHAVRLYHPFLIIGVGQLIFSAALLAAGFSENYEMLLVCRTMVGVAEPSFIVVAPAMIDLIAPESHRGLWLALFYMAISVGSAGGFLLGMLVKDEWRWSFRIQAMLNFPLAILFLVARPREYEWDYLKDNCEDTAAAEDEARSFVSIEDRERLRNSTRQNRLSITQNVRDSFVGAAVSNRSVWGDIKHLMSSSKYNLLWIGFSVMQAVGGVIVFWGPKAGRQVYELENADLYFGIMVVITGIGGTLTGGFILDKLGGGLSQAALFSGCALISAGFFTTLAFHVPPNDPSVYAFFTLFSIGYFCLASFYGPCVSSLLWVTEPEYRAQSVGFATFLSHVFGDVPSPYYAGAIQDSLVSWKWTMTIIMPLLIAAGVFFLVCWRIQEKDTDKKYRIMTQEQQEYGTSAAGLFTEDRP